MEETATATIKLNNQLKIKITMGKIKLYSAICYDAYMAKETGFHWHNHEPRTTQHYKYEHIQEHTFILPDDITSEDVIGVYTEFDNMPLIETKDGVFKLTKEI